MKNKKKTGWTRRRKISLLAIIVVVPGIVVGLYFGAYKLMYFNDVANQAGITQTRELILLAVNNLKKDVPVEPKTGDLYFPESRLYLPNPKSQPKLTYAWYGGEESGEEDFSVSLSQVPGTPALYAARNVEELFNAVPKLQSCSRGVKISYQKLPLDMEPVNKLKHTVSLQNGKAAYLYAEESCPELDEVVDLLKNLQSY